jgi:hypothetical protein
MNIKEPFINFQGVNDYDIFINLIYQACNLGRHHLLSLLNH